MIQTISMRAARLARRTRAVWWTGIALTAGIAGCGGGGGGGGATPIPPAVSVQVSPKTATVQANGGTLTFTAVVLNASTAAVTWDVDGTVGGSAAVGTIVGGVYTAPATVPAGGAVTVHAVSVADPTKSDSATVTVTATSPPVSVTIAPKTASVQVGTGSQAFTATVSNTSNTAVTWDVNGTVGGNGSVGTISTSGVYAAPASVPAGGTVTVHAVSQADQTKSDSATVTITAPLVSVTVSPKTTTVQANIGSQTFTATVTNAANTAVTWDVNGVIGGNATVGTITTGGVYTAPATVPTGGTVTVRAVSQADQTKSDSATVTITAPVSVSIAPKTVSLSAAGGAQTFIATVANAANTSVTWDVNGVVGGNATLGTITTAGAYSAPATVPNPATVTVRAVSAADPTKFATAQVTITPSTGVSVVVTPRRAALTTQQSQQFTAAVTGSTNSAVTWSVDGVAGGNSTVGTVSATGLYAPPTSAGVHSVVATSVAAPSQSASVSVAVTDLAGILTQRYDSARTGQNLKEYALTPALLRTAGAFGKLFSCPVDASVYAEPLYVANLAIGGGTHNVVFVATENDSVYAFDADASPCVTYWNKSFLGTGVVAVPAVDSGETGDLPGTFGVTGTPVIDLASGAIYVIANTKENGATYYYRLHALSLATGGELPNSPVVIQPTVSGITFDPIAHLQRPGLLLVGSTVYVAFGSHGDKNVYYGWVMSFDKTTLTLNNVFNTAPHSNLSGNGGQASIWMSGAGPAADPTGNIYFSTANGTFTATTNQVPAPSGSNDFGDTVVKLTSALALSDYFTPADQSTLNGQDWDLGSGGVVVLPDSAGSTSHPHLALTADKEANLFLIDRDNMGRFATPGNANLQTVAINSQGACVTCGMFTTPSVWNGTVYVGAINDAVKAFSIASGVLGTLPTSQTADSYQFPGTNTVVSASGTTNGVLWALDTNSAGTTSTTSVNGPAVLRAYDATNLATRLWSSDARAQDAAVNAVKFVVPTVANGKVYVVGQGSLTVYGLQP